MPVPPPSKDDSSRPRGRESDGANNNKIPAVRPYQPIPGAAPERKAPPPPPPPPGQLFGPDGLQDRASRRKKKTKNKNPNGPRRAIPFKAGLGYGFLILVVLLGLLVLFISTRVFNFLNGISVERPDASGNVISGSSVSGHGRVNIVLLGLDRRPNDNEGTRSDTMLLLSIDQDNKGANILSIPRDLWIKIPGHGNNRINAAYSFGDQERPGKGGPPLVKQTIKENFGIQVDYFVEVDFNGFRSTIDAIGGITLDVKKPLVDNEYPTEDYGIKRIYIPAGLQRMDGQTALEYARSRHSDSDLGRNQRQQEVLLAIREQGVNLGLLTNTQLQSALQSAIKTDLTPGDMVALGQLAIGMKRDSIRQFSIDANNTRSTFIDGNDVLVPDMTSINQLLHDFQTSSGPVNTKEATKINILNGTFTSGLAARTQKYLESKGFTIGNVDQASNAGKYPQTVINVYNGKQSVANDVANALGVSANQIKAKTGGPTGVDIEVICGDDLKIPE
jgi:polyisoprenyl-teichoic acid--peptidoglycan teichoic acid transferase